MTVERPLQPEEIRHWSFSTDSVVDPQADVTKVVTMFEGKEADELTPAYDAIDHFMTNLFTNPPPDEAQAQSEFAYEGYRISVYQDSEVRSFTFTLVFDQPQKRTPRGRCSAALCAV